jgi:hypothetical protein
MKTIMSRFGMLIHYKPSNLYLQGIVLNPAFVKNCFKLNSTQSRWFQSPIFGIKCIILLI